MRERDEAHVVVVERVRGGAVGERRVAGARRAARCPNTRHGAAAVCRDHALDDARGRLGGAGQRHADRVEHAPRRARRAPRPAARAARRTRRDVTSRSCSRPPMRRGFRIADRGHEPLLDEHAVERRLRGRRRLRRPSRRSPTARLGARARERRASSSVARRAPSPSRRRPSRAPPRRDRRRAPSASADRRSSRTPRCPSRRATRFAGRSRPIVASEPRFISSEPSPSSTKTRRSGRASARPRPIDEASPMLPQV